MLTIQSPHSNQIITHNSSSSKIDLLSNVSPTFRNKRIPSAHDNYSYSSNHNLKIIKTQSPSKASQKLKRRKSQYINTNSYLDNNQTAPQKKKSSKSIHQNVNNISSPVNLCVTPSHKDLLNFPLNSQTIINEMTLLKNEYKQLKKAYKQLIQQKINNAQKMNQLKQQKQKLQSQLQLVLSKHKNCKNEEKSLISEQQLKSIQNENIILKQNKNFFERQLDRIKKECYKLLQGQRFKIKKLQDNLKEKDIALNILKKQLSFKDSKHYPGNSEESQYSVNFNNFNVLTEDGIVSSLNQKITVFNKHQNFYNCTPRISNNEGIKHSENQFNGYNTNQMLQFSCDQKSFQGQSQFISISLTSVMEQSVYKGASKDIQSNRVPQKHDNFNIKQNKQPLQQIHFNHAQSNETVLHKQNHSNKQKAVYQGIQNTSNNNVQYGLNNQKAQKQNIKKMRKQVHQKLEINLNHFDQKKQIYSIKTPVSNNGLGMKSLSTKNKNSKSKKKEEDKQNNWNLHCLKQNSQTNLNKNTKKKQKSHSNTYK